MADAAGNVWIGATRELMTMAHAARVTVVTVETLHDQNLLEDPVLAAGTLAGFYVEKVAIAPRGAWPLALPNYYARDEAHLAEYARLAASIEGFARYLDLYVHERRAA
jgi:glutaconate CoA-transferase subunit A